MARFWVPKLVKISIAHEVCYAVLCLFFLYPRICGYSSPFLKDKKVCFICGINTEIVVY